MEYYIFSLTPATYQKIKGLLREVDNIQEQLAEVKTDDEGEALVEAKGETLILIERMLLGSADRREPLKYFEHEMDEGNMVEDFECFFIKHDSSLRREMDESPLPPRKVKKLWAIVSSKMGEAGTKKELMKYAKQQNVDQGYRSKPAELDAVFKKWLSILKHAAENGNWYHMSITYI